SSVAVSADAGAAGSSVIARRILRRCPSRTPRSLRSCSVRSRMTERSMALSANRWAYSLRPIDANHSVMPFMAFPVDPRAIAAPAPRAAIQPRLRTRAAYLETPSKNPVESKGAVSSIRVRGAHGNSFDHLVGERQQFRRYFEPERLRGLEVDHQLELGRRLHRKLGRLGALENAVNVGCRPPELVAHLGPIGQKTAARRIETIGIDRGQAMAGRQRDDKVATIHGAHIWQHDQAAVRHAREGLDGHFDASGVRRCGRHRLYRE